MIAALYVDPDGTYANLPDVELWDETRDARTYPGPWPVVAHPPCARWCALAPLLESLHGLELGADGGCFEAALGAVRRFGGVLEHPAYSFAWRRFDLPRPAPGGWTGGFWDGGWTTEIDQSAYGHPARKRTWLYVYGADPPALEWRSPPVARAVSAFRHRPRGDYGVPEELRVRPGPAAATPPRFRDALLAIARAAA